MHRKQEGELKEERKLILFQFLWVQIIAHWNKSILTFQKSLGASWQTSEALEKKKKQTLQLDIDTG